MHHVAVGQHQAVGSKHKSRSPALTLARFSGTASARLRNLNFDHRRADRFRRPDDSLRVGIKQRRVIERTHFCRLDYWLGIIRHGENTILLAHSC